MTALNCFVLYHRMIYYIFRNIEQKGAEEENRFSASFYDP